MAPFFRKLSLYFSAGALGGLLNSITLWILGEAGATAALGIGVAPMFTLPWLYPRIGWGGLWGAAFLLPIARRPPARRGFLVSLGPTAVQLLVVFPYQANQGLFGLRLGTLTPLLVVVLNAVWGITAAYWLWYLRAE